MPRGPQGYYTGVFGYFDGRDLDSAVMIRYIECENGRFYFRSGGGITVHSDPQQEYDEVVTKIYLPIPDCDGRVALHRNHSSRRRNFRSSRTSFASYAADGPRSIRRRLRFRFGGWFDSASASEGTVKCRIVYGRSLSEISFAPYVPREIRSLRLVAADDELDYHLKYADRSALARLLQRRDDCDEILIVRDGAITDTSYSNVAFFDGRKYVTPDTFLLNGTRRQYLLGTGVLTECRITPSDLGGFERVVLINAMLGIEDDLAVPIERIRGL